MPSQAIVIVDDDPMHLRIYSWIVEARGYRAFPALVTIDQIDLPADTGGPVSLVMLDYHLTSAMTAVQAAHVLKGHFPDAPIVLLSDAFALPDDIAPYVNGFIRKGDPAKLVNALADFLHPTV